MLNIRSWFRKPTETDPSDKRGQMMDEMREDSCRYLDRMQSEEGREYLGQLKSSNAVHAISDRERRIAKAEFRNASRNEKKSLDELKQILDGYSDETIDLIHSELRGTAYLRDYVSTALNEAQLCAAIHYDISPAMMRHYYHPVRSSLGIYDIGALAKDSEEYRIVAATFAVAIGASKERHRQKYEVRGERTAGGGYISTMSPVDNCPEMTPELARITAYFPDRVEFIINYIDNLEGNIELVDAEHLRLSLESGSPSLAIGVL